MKKEWTNIQALMVFLNLILSDPAIKPNKTMSNIRAQDDARLRKVPIGRFDTTYRREFNNFNNVS